MPVAIVVSLLGLAAVLVAYYRDPPLVERRLEPPDWGLLPDPADMARLEFPLAIPGYDPATVEFHFELVTRAYADLLAAATPEVIARARQRAALRQGLDPDDVPPATAATPDPSALTPLVPEGHDTAALRAEAALADLDAAQPPGPEPTR